MFTEALIFRIEILRAARTHHADTDHDNILIIRAGARKSPLEREWIGGVAHRNHYAARANGRRLAADRLLVLQLEMVPHLARRNRVLLQVRTFRDSKDDEEYSRK